MIFFKRIGAYLVDCIILFFAIIIVNLFIPITGDITELNTNLTNLMNDYIQEKITIEEFTSHADDLNYQITKATYISSIASIVVYLLYFVVFQAYNKGQTLGKKLFKIHIVKKDDSRVDINTLLIRSLIPYGILVNFILAIVILFVNQGIYTSVSNILNNIHIVVIVITLIMMMVKSRGAHDYLANTKVEQV